MESQALFRAAADVTAQVHAALEACERGALPPAIAFMQICMAAAHAQEVAAALASVETNPNPYLAALVRLGRGKPEAWALVHQILDAVSHEGHADESAAEAVRRYAESFDRAAAIAPEASVALYSLGDPAVLAAATAEIVAGLTGWGLVAPDRVWLDIGCGIGRFEQALAPHVAAITGLDVSARMVAEAQNRCAGLANVTIAQTAGLDLSDFAAGAFDVVLAVDAFPYLTQPDPVLAAIHVAESARVLRTGGYLAIFNYSYRDDIEADKRDITVLAARHGFAMRRVGARDCPSWDGVTFLLQKL